MMKQGGVTLDDDKIKSPGHEITFQAGDEFALKVGKRNFAKLKAE
jgi:hypothetical protein